MPERTVDQASQRHLRILTEVSERDDVTQRDLADSLGIALGLTNLYLKRLARKGYIKVTTIPRNRLRYLVTPKGFAQKSRLTYEYLTFSLVQYRQARERLRAALGNHALAQSERIALFGTGEAAELAYLTLRELGVEPVAIYGDDGRQSFLGMPVQPQAAMASGGFDRVIVASFVTTPEKQRTELARLVPRAKLVFLGP